MGDEFLEFRRVEVADPCLDAAGVRRRATRTTFFTANSTSAEAGVEAAASTSRTDVTTRFGNL